MKKKRVMKNGILSLLLLSLFAVFTSEAANESSIDQKSPVKNLFMIVMNGVRYDDALGNKNHLYTENIWTKLRPLGAICTRFYNRELTYPVPAQMSLLTGVWHILANPLSETVRPAFPTLFEYWNRKGPGGSCYFAASRKIMEILTCSGHKDYGKVYAPVFATNEFTSIDTSFKEGKTEVIENAIYEKAVSYIFERHPSFVYLNVGSGRGDEDYSNPHKCLAKDTGTKDSCGGYELLNAYYESIILVDAIVYDLWDRIQHDETYKENSIFIVMSDHGRHTNDFYNFGDKCRGCQQLNFLIIGPGIKKNFTSKRERSIIDVCRTVGALFDLPTPFSKGNIMKEILE
jgi:hypothetical protein